MTTDIDLFRDDFSRFGDPELFEAVETFTRVKLPDSDRTQEGYLVDFKAIWCDTALHAVAAFANTFGGILLVGISDIDGRADQIVGVSSQRQELKTSIASSIASNISPTPPYEIRDVAFPGDPTRHLCIVRVRKGNALYLLTKKGERPVYVRNEDESIPADAARLQALLATRAAAGHAAPSDPLQYQQASIGMQQLYVTVAKNQNGQIQRCRSETFLQISLQPQEPLEVRLDLALERKLLLIVRETYPGIARTVDEPARQIGASLTDSRLRDWYLVRYFEELRDYEMKWAVDDLGRFHFVTQVACRSPASGEQPKVWSICDLMTNLDCTIQAAHEFWEYLEYPGEAHIVAQLQVEELPLLELGDGSESAYSSAFYERDGKRRRARPLRSAAVIKPPKQGNRAGASTSINYAARFGSHGEPVSLLTNQLLRDLGYALNLSDLKLLF